MSRVDEIRERWCSVPSSTHACSDVTFLLRMLEEETARLAAAEKVVKAARYLCRVNPNCTGYDSLMATLHAYDKLTEDA